MRELQGRWPGLHWGRWKVGGRSKPPHSAPMAVCGICDARDGERIRSRELPRTGLVRVAGTFDWSLGGSVAGWPSGREWHGSQPGHGASELGFPRPVLGEMQSEVARRAGDPSHQGEDPSPEGLGGHGWFAQTNPRRPSSVPGYARSPGPPARRPSASSGLAAKRPEGRWFSPTPYLKSRMAFSTSAWRRRPAGIRPSRTRFEAPEITEPTGKGHPAGKSHSPARAGQGTG